MLPQQKLFEKLEELPIQNLNIADAVSGIDWNRKIKLNLGKSIKMEARYTPDFSSNMIDSQIPSDHFEVQMISTLRSN